MAQDESLQKFLLEVVQAFTQNPDSLRVLLDNPVLNQALSNYVDSAAERMRPKTEWVDIWNERGEEVRLFKPDRGAYYPHWNDSPLVNDVVEVVFIIAAIYYPAKGAVICRVGITESENRPMFDYGRRERVSLFVESAYIEAQEDAIEWVQSLKEKARARFIEATMPLAVEGA